VGRTFASASLRERAESLNAGSTADVLVGGNTPECRSALNADLKCAPARLSWRRRRGGHPVGDPVRTSGFQVDSAVVGLCCWAAEWGREAAAFISRRTKAEK
jgi:hypothetical protein